MRSIRACLASIVFLLWVPMAALYQLLINHGFDTFIHGVLAVGTWLLASAVPDFDKTPKWISWTARAGIAAEGVIFFLQGVSHLLQNDMLTWIAYQVLGQHVEALLVDVFVLWCIAVLMFDSHGKTRILGAVAVAAAVAFEVYRYLLASLGKVPAEGLKLSLLLLFVWLLLESRKPKAVHDARPPTRPFNS